VATLPPGGGRRTASLGGGTSRSRTVVIGQAGRNSTIPTPVTQGVGSSYGLATVLGVGSFDAPGNAILLETGDILLLEIGDRLLIEDALTTASAAGVATVSGVGAARVDRSARTEGLATVSGVMEVPGAAANILLENGDDLLMETGDLLLLETGVVIPPTVLLDTDGFPIFDTSGEYILEA
jgi:hypothetical protein